MNNNYTIYKFTFSDGKIYIGQTSQPVEERWKNGEGYKGQDVYVPINHKDMDLDKLFKDVCSYIKNMTAEELSISLQKAEEDSKDSYLFDDYDN